MPSLKELPADQIEQLVKRRHPFYGRLINHWRFLEATYRGGRDWFFTNIFKYIKEGPKEFEDRTKRAYRFNHTREVVDLINKYVFKGDIARREDAPDSVREFWKRATREGRDINFLMRDVSRVSSNLGRAYVIVDTNAPSEDARPLSKAEQKEQDIRAYAYVVRPQDMVDIAFNEDGTVRWGLVYEPYRDDADPILNAGEVTDRYRLWTETHWHLFEVRQQEDAAGAKENIYLFLEEGEHNLGRAPIIPINHLEFDSDYDSPALVGDIAYLDRAIANYLSNLDAIIQDQSFSQLAMPAQGVMPGEESHSKLIELGTKRIFLYDGESGAAPHYLSPDPKQANVIVMVVNKIIGEIYHSIGMAGERTKQDNAVGIDNSSGVAKAYDFERLNALLVSKARNLEWAEREIAALVARWNGENLDPADIDYIEYPASYDVRNLYDEFEIAEKLALVDAPEEMRRHQMETLIDKLFPQLSEDLVEKIKADLKDWPAVEFPGMANTSISLKGIPGGKAEADSRQGQVTSETEDA